MGSVTELSPSEDRRKESVRSPFEDRKKQSVRSVSWKIEQQKSPNLNREKTY